MRNLIDALPYLAGGVALVALVALFVSDRAGANEHDLSDYHEAAPVNTEPARDRLRLHRLKLAEYQCPTERGPSVTAKPDDILPPAPPGTDAGGSPLFGAVAVDMAVPTLTDAEVRQRAAEILRELGEHARAEMAVA